MAGIYNKLVYYYWSIFINKKPDDRLNDQLNDHFNDHLEWWLSFIDDHAYSYD